MRINELDITFICRLYQCFNEKQNTQAHKLVMYVLFCLSFHLLSFTVFFWIEWIEIKIQNRIPKVIKFHVNYISFPLQGHLRAIRCDVMQFYAAHVLFCDFIWNFVVPKNKCFFSIFKIIVHIRYVSLAPIQHLLHRWIVHVFKYLTP